jgi:hypothetical protein
MDAECMQLPAGWTLVARVAVGGSPPPSCPAKMKPNGAVLFESPSAKSDTCTCDGCNVTAPAGCSGQVTHKFGSTNACPNTGASGYYTNPQAGQCATDLYNGPRFTAYYAFDLPQASGGTCQANAPVLHGDRFDVNARALVCDDESRCSGGVCDARIDAPFAVCVAQAGSQQCPAGFSDRHVAGDAATADCASTCGCSLTRGKCTGTVNHYTDTNCTMGLDTFGADGTCTAVNLTGEAYASYKVVATSQTTCTVSGSSAANNARLVSPRTICCR